MSEKSGRIRRLTIEFVVIVAGVLIALAVDRTVQASEEESLERSYLEALLADFREGATTGTYAAQFMRERVELIEMLDRAVETGAAPDSISPDQFAHAVELAGWHPGVSFPKTAWEDLTNTGRMVLVSNPEIRRAVTEFYLQLEWLQSLDVSWTRRVEVYHRESSLVIPPRVKVAIARCRMSDGDNVYDAPEISVMIRRMQARPEYRAALGETLLVADLLGGTLIGTTGAAQRVVELLEAELGVAPVETPISFEPGACG